MPSRWPITSQAEADAIRAVLASIEENLAAIEEGDSEIAADLRGEAVVMRTALLEWDSSERGSERG